jgi:hypothetical protein
MFYQLRRLCFQADAQVEIPRGLLLNKAFPDNEKTRLFGLSQILPRARQSLPSRTVPGWEDFHSCPNFSKQSVLRVSALWPVSQPF